jgi:hypothetical protein
MLVMAASPAKEFVAPIARFYVRLSTVSIRHPGCRFAVGAKFTVRSSSVRRKWQPLLIIT